ncbi:hypothetical protein KUV65_10985 [Maritalea mobilis]|uniref:Uncharacterized protein n=1 Tax=[Roseibacterium] beibuensis TaxID=1193142 RepID=A0ABP9LAU8_9RHOB|nr:MULTISPECIES: hypothetical protein [Alphaproteobacteria]MBY6201889.1 hypothetical protein [Maritalea mobilis]MCS6626623.1 hypothetical protein [Roseibacterium beibuensis]
MTLPDVPSDILLVIATLVSGMALASSLAGWVNGRWPIAALLSLAIGVGLFVFLHLSLPGGLEFWDIPDAFILVAARILN